MAMDEIDAQLEANICPICLQAFSGHLVLVKHVFHIHVPEESKTVMNQTKKPKRSCDKNVQTEVIDLVEENETEEPRILKVRSDLFPRNNQCQSFLKVRSDLLIEKNETFGCEFCDESFQSKAERWQHFYKKKQSFLFLL